VYLAVSWKNRNFAEKTKTKTNETIIILIGAIALDYRNGAAT
jgi:hypothetical protein